MCKFPPSVLFIFGLEREVQVAMKRIAILVQRQWAWRLSSTLLQRRAFSDISGSGIARGKDEEVTRKALEAAAREDRLDFQTAARLLMSSPADERKFGWDFHLVQFFFACLPPLAVYAFAQYSRYDQRQMLKERDTKIEKLVEAELEIEVGVELEEVSAMLNSRNPDLEALKLRLEALEEKLLQLEPALKQNGNLPPKTTDAAAVPQENSTHVSQQGTNQQKPKLEVSELDTRGCTSTESKGESRARGYWTWFIGKRGAVSSDIPAKEQ